MTENDHTSVLWNLHLDSKAEYRTGRLDVACQSYGPTDSIPGAFFDIIPRSDGHLALVVGEAISGYQFTAAFMTHVRSILQVLARLSVEPDAALAASNEFVLRNEPQGIRHICVFLAIAEPSTGAVRYAYAGGDTARLLTTGGKIRPLAATGPIVGVLPGAEYGVSDLSRLDAGSVLLVSTEPMGEERGLDTAGSASLRRHASRCSEAASILAGLHGDLDAHRPDGLRSELLTMAVRVME